MAVTEQSRTMQGPEPGDCPPGVNQPECSPAEKRGLLIVGCYKLAEGLFFIGVGAGALHLIHKDVGYLVMRVVNALPVDPEGRLVSILMDKADLIDAHDLRRIGDFAFLYAATRLVEGTGLLMRKAWAEYFTVILTVLGLPVEIFELMRRATWLKAGAFVVNLAILIYLIWVLKQRQRVPLSGPANS
jgi:uncharacterized membrane protein (DUF2068 family)